jgi:hypothetical protein
MSSAKEPSNGRGITIPGGAVLGLVLALSGTAVAREHFVVQKSASVLQKRSANAWIDQANPTANQNNANPLQVQTSSLTQPGQNKRALLLFDFAPVPAVGIKSAVLTLNFVTAPAPIVLVYNARYLVSRVTTFWNPAFVTWNNHISGGQPGWTTAGGDLNATNQASSIVAVGPTTWDITAITQLWNTSAPNYGIIIQDSQENGLLAAHSGTISSNADPTDAKHPSLALDFIQHVQGLTATASNATVTLNWSYPTAIGTVTTPTKGVVIVRAIGSPVPDTVFPADGTSPAVCSTIGAGNVVVFNSNALATTFTDSGGCGALTNDSSTFYKVFAFDQSGAVSTIGYDTNGATSLDAPMALATPSATAPQAALWTLGTGATTLGAPGIIPADKILAGNNNGKVFTAKVSDGTPAFAPIAVNAAVSARPPLLANTDVTPSVGRNIAYVPDQLDAIYGIDTDTGEFLWQTVSGGTTIANAFTGSVAVQLKGTSNGSYTQAQDLVVTGQRTAGGSTSANFVVGLNGNDGSQRWISTGGSSTASATGCGGNCNMDIITSTPQVDYAHNVIWVTSFNNAGSGGAANAPDLWEFNSNASGPSSPVLGVANLGSNISSSPTLTPQNDVLLVGLDTGILKAMDPVNTTAGVINTLGTCPSPSVCITTDGAIKGAPLALSNTSPYTVIYATNSQIRAVSFNKNTNTFVLLWQNTTSCSNPSAPIGTPRLTGNDAVTSAPIDVLYIGCNNGKILELRASNGTLNKTRTVNNTGTVGDIALDLQSAVNKVIAGSTAGRLTAFGVPF